MDQESTGIKEVAIGKVARGDSQDVNDILLGWSQLGDKAMDSAIVEEDLTSNDVLECGEKIFRPRVADIPAVGHEMIQATISLRYVAPGCAFYEDDHLECNLE